MPADAHVDPGAVGFDLTRLHTGREGVDAILMSVVVHRFYSRFEGTWVPQARAARGRVAPGKVPSGHPGAACARLATVCLTPTQKVEGSSCARKPLAERLFLGDSRTGRAARALGYPPRYPRRQTL